MPDALDRYDPTSTSGHVPTGTPSTSSSVSGLASRGIGDHPGRGGTHSPLGLDTELGRAAVPTVAELSDAAGCLDHTPPLRIVRDDLRIEAEPRRGGHIQIEDVKVSQRVAFDELASAVQRRDRFEERGVIAGGEVSRPHQFRHFGELLRVQQETAEQTALRLDRGHAPRPWFSADRFSTCEAFQDVPRHELAGRHVPSTRRTQMRQRSVRPALSRMHSTRWVPEFTMAPVILSATDRNRVTDLTASPAAARVHAARSPTAVEAPI